MSPVVAAPETEAAAAAGPRHSADAPAGPRRTLPRPRTEAALTVGLAAILCAVVFGAEGGQRVLSAAPIEMGLLVAGGLTVALAVLRVQGGTRLWGSGPVLLLGALALLTALSIGWSVNPSESWIEANRIFAYVAAFAGAVALAHLVPHRTSAVIGAITLASVVVCAYAALTKVFPGLLNESDIYARLREPFGYWNAIGLAAALGVPGCLWLGSRRDGHQALSALAHPALGLLLTTLMLSYSRGSLVAAAAGAAVFIAIVPLRLRAAAVLLSGIAGAGLISGWVFTQDALTDDFVPLDVRETVGLQLGLLAVVVLGLLTMAGLATTFSALVRPPGAQLRRRAGMALLVGLALVPVAVAGKLAVSDRGLTGSISHAVETFTDPDAAVPDNTPGRFTSSGSVRAEYWDEAIRIGKDNRWIGVGAGGYATVRPRYSDQLDVRHAHGYLAQTFSDLGLVGVGLSLALLAAWLVAAVRACGLWPWARGAPRASGSSPTGELRGIAQRSPDRRQPVPRQPVPERVGLVALLAIAVTFGIHSLLDWTWLVPGTAVTGLLAAGWLAGRGPLHRQTGPGPALGVDALRAALRERVRVAGAAAAVVISLVGAYAVWQPLRSFNASQDALVALEDGDVREARQKAETARDRNPLALEPLYTLSTIEAGVGRVQNAQKLLQEAVRTQPDNADPWLRLAQFNIDVINDPQGALNAVRAALYLDPRNQEAADVFLTATRRAAAPG